MRQLKLKTAEGEYIVQMSEQDYDQLLRRFDHSLVLPNMRQASTGVWDYFSPCICRHHITCTGCPFDHLPNRCESVTTYFDPDVFVHFGVATLSWGDENHSAALDVIHSIHEWLLTAEVCGE